MLLVMGRTNLAPKKSSRKAARILFFALVGGIWGHAPPENFEN